jgi:hypothetical protein
MLKCLSIVGDLLDSKAVVTVDYSVTTDCDSGPVVLRTYK